MKSGIRVRSRPEHYPLWKTGLQKLIRPQERIIATEIEKTLFQNAPSLVVFSDGALPPPDLMEVCAKHNWPFVTICQATHEQWWPSDEVARRYRTVLSYARRCFFVSQANLTLAEKQIACDLQNAEVVRNPFGVPFDVPASWPPLGSEGEVGFACVARLDPEAKGQDLLLEVLAKPAWRDRKWRLMLYGEGRCRQTVERMVEKLGLCQRVRFAGHVPVQDIWKADHVLVLPSRYEGLPLAIVEAMLCGRPVLTTDVAGNAEVVEDGITGILADAATSKSIELALERLWERRADLEQMGNAGRQRIRQLVPAHPAQVFAERLKALAK